MIISKELLGEVLCLSSCEIVKANAIMINIDAEVEENSLTYRIHSEFETIENNITFKQGSSISCINIHDLANKCKEWANEEGYSIATRLMTYKWFIDLYRYESKKPKEKDFEMFDTEPEAIFKACEWILENKG